MQQEPPTVANDDLTLFHAVADVVAVVVAIIVVAVVAVVVVWWCCHCGCDC